LQELQSRVSRCLMEVFPGKRILPHHIPSFLEGVVNPITISATEADIDVDIAKLHGALFREGFNLLEAKEFLKGRNMFRALLILSPNDVTSTYNLACAESLLGNIPEALTCLEKAIDLGYSNMDHILTHSDLQNIHNHPVFTELVERLRQTLSPQVPVDVLPEVTPQPISYKQPVTQLEVIPQPVCEPRPVSKPEVIHQPICEPVQVAPPKWATELSVLHDVGYLDDELLISLLERTKGSVEQTVLALLDL